EWFRNPDLARTLRLIAEQGIGELYGGELGRRIAERVRALGGYLTVDDFKSHRPEWVEPIAVTFRGYRVWELPANRQGVAARGHRPRPRRRPPRAREAADRERDDLPHRRRLERQHRVVHQLAVRCVRLRCGRAGHRVRAAGPWRGIHARAGAAEHGRPREATVPYHHPRVRHAARRRGWGRALAQLRGHGRV